LPPVAAAIAHGWLPHPGYRPQCRYSRVISPGVIPSLYHPAIRRTVTPVPAIFGPTPTPYCRVTVYESAGFHNRGQDFSVSSQEIGPQSSRTPLTTPAHYADCARPRRSHASPRPATLAAPLPDRRARSADRARRR